MQRQRRMVPAPHADLSGPTQPPHGPPSSSDRAHLSSKERGSTKPASAGRSPAAFGRTKCSMQRIAEFMEVS